MILVSIQPFAPRKIFALAAAVICLSTASCFASALLLPVDSTPYDRQMSRIRPVLLTKGANTSHEVSLALVNEWMGSLRDIPYGYHIEWKTPSEVNSREPADCKGKAVALYERMQSFGAKNIRLVIGKRAPTSRMTHAWLVWQTSRGTYVLDPTFHWAACRSEEIAEGSYVPHYAYAGDKKFRAAASASLYASN